MVKRGDAGNSFDPRTWTGKDGKPAAPEPAAPGDAAANAPASFDPRSWATTPTTPGAQPAGIGGTPPAPPVDGPIAPPPIADPPAVRHGRGREIAAALTALAILGAGATAALLMRAPAVETPVTPTPAATETAAPVVSNSRTLQVAAPDAILEALLTAGIDPAQAKAAAAGAQAALGDQPGEIRLVFSVAGTTGDTDRGTGQLIRLAATRGDGSGVQLAQTADGGFKAAPLAARLSTKLTVVSGEMDTSSFYNAAVTAGVIDSLVSDFAAAFSFDFDFQQEILPGDVFEAGFEQSVNAAGETFGEPRLVYASLRTKTKTRQLYRFTPPGEADPGWFDANGRSIVRSLMRTPIDGARVTSKFGYRVHPVLGYTKLHGGTDFGAPTGTPIYAAGDGLIQVASLRGAAGNMVQILHDNGWVTHYFHMSRFGDGITPGVRVKQGQVVGAVGTTGRSTGPHLHYEVIIDGQKVDPLSIDTGTGVTLAGPALAAFTAERDRIDLSRSQQSQ